MVSSPTAYVAQYDVSGSRIMRQVKAGGVAATASGNTEVVAAVSGFKIRVLTCLVTNRASAAINVKFQSATTDIDGAEAHQLAADGGGWALGAQEGGFLFETAAGAALNVNLGATGDVMVSLTYIEG